MKYIKLISRWVFAVALGVTVLKPVTALGQPNGWVQRIVTGPSARVNHEMVFDGARSVTVLFGGITAVGGVSNETWEWSGATWNQAAAIGPSPRYSTGMAYDSVREETVIFGGNLGGSLNSNETWVWNGTTWTQRVVSGPSARYAHAMAFDSNRGVIVLFGGFNSNTNNTNDETWEWDGSAWSQRVVSGPSARVAHRMAYDSIRRVTVLYGGNLQNGANSGDTWEWNGSVWVLRAVNGPSVRDLHAMVYDSDRQVTVLFGGLNVNSLGETWEWSGNAWTQRAITSPPPRFGHAMAYDEVRKVTVLFGGDSGFGTQTGDTWELGVPPVIYVKQDAAGSNTGRSWTDAFSGVLGLQNALTLASTYSSSTIWVAAGTYKPAGSSGDRAATFQLRSGLALYGGFLGNETLFSQRNVVFNETFLSGDLNGDDVLTSGRTENSFHVLFASGVNPSAVLDGFTVSHGFANGDPGNSQNQGGGLYAENASPTIRNCTFRDNAAVSGGAISSLNSNMVVSSSSFVQNSAGNQGGAIWLQVGTPQIIACNFDMNTATIHGGAISATTPIPLPPFCSPVILRSSFAGNSVDSLTGDGGGAIYAYNCQSTIQNCGFLGNAGSLGSAIYSFYGHLSLNGCLLVGNARNSVLGGGGGALDVDGSDRPGTFIGSADITNCTIAYNQMPPSAATAGVFFGQANSAAASSITNSIIWGNSVGADHGQNAQLYNPGITGVQVTSSIVEGWTDQIRGVGSTGLNPMFASAPPSQGPDGFWGTQDDVGDLKLLTGSSAIDTGDNSFVPVDTYDVDGNGNTFEPYPIDLNGAPRVLDDPQNAGVGIDRGCYEFVSINCPACPGLRRWISPAVGDFLDPLNWSPSIPNSAHDTLFDLASSYSVDFPMAAQNYAKSAIIRRGDVTFSFANSSWNLTAATDPALQIGDTLPSLASLTVTGGTLQSFSALIGTNAGSQGNLRVTGAGSTVNIPHDMSIGFFGRGTALIDNGGRLITRTAGVGDQPGSEGSYVQVTGAGSRWDVPFFLQINNGEVNISSGATLNAGFGIFLFQGGTLSGDGIINGDVVNFGAIRPGNSPGTLTINGNYEQVGILPELGASSGRLIAEVGGTPSSGTFDKLIVNGSASLGGLLQVSLANGYVPAPTDSFQLVRAAGSVQSAFDVAYFPGLANQRFLNVSYVSGPNGLGTIELKNSPLGDGSDFGDNRPFGVNGGPTALAVGDLNGDSFPDMAITVPDTLDPTGQTGFLNLLINDGGTGQNWNGFRSSIQIPVGRNPVDLVLTDLDNDPLHRLDIAVVNRSSGSVTILRNDGTDGNQDPILNTAVTLTGFSDPRGIAAGNIDRNFPANPNESQYRKDLAVSNFASGDITTFGNTSTAGNLVFSGGTNQFVGNGPRRIICADIDNDKDLPTAGRQQSILVLRPSDNTLSILHRNQNSEGFVQTDYPVGIDPVDVVVSHLRNSALPADVAVVNQGSDSVSILVNRSGGEFSPPVSLSVGDAPTAIVATNVDGDDDVDLAFCSGEPGFREVQLLRNDISGPQLAFVLLNGQVTSGTSPKFIAAANVDNDAQQGDDLVTIDGSGARDPANIRVIRNRLTDVNCPPDFNHDTAVDFFDYLDFVDAFSADDPSADFNSDTSIDFFDYLDFVDAFSIGC